MRAEELLEEVKALGVMVTLDHQDLVLRPKSRLSPELVHQLRAHKRELLNLVELQGWPAASRDSVLRFRVPEARLFPFISEVVLTPEGQGQLLAVLGARVEVGIGGRVFSFLPSEIRPPGAEWLYEGPFEAVH